MASSLGPGRAGSLTRRGPESNVTCQSGFDWADDKAGNTPCLVAAAVVGGCGNSGEFLFYWWRRDDIYVHGWRMFTLNRLVSGNVWLTIPFSFFSLQTTTSPY